MYTEFETTFTNIKKDDVRSSLKSAGEYVGKMES